MKRINKTQALHDFLLTLPKDGYPPLTRRNGRPSDGWSYGNCRLSRAIRGTGLPYAKFWSGSCPTPSTQWPTSIRDAAQAAGLLD